MGLERGGLAREVQKGERTPKSGTGRDHPSW